MRGRILIVTTNLLTGEHVKNLFLAADFDVHHQIYTVKELSNIYYYLEFDYLVVEIESISKIKELFEKMKINLNPEFMSLGEFDLFANSSLVQLLGDAFKIAKIKNLSNYSIKETNKSN